MPSGRSRSASSAQRPRAETRRRQRRHDRRHPGHPAARDRRSAATRSPRLGRSVVRQAVDPAAEPAATTPHGPPRPRVVLRLGRDPPVVRPHVLDHLRERRDPGDRVLGELPGERDRTQQLAVDIDRAAAHPLDDPGVLEVAPRQPAEDHVAARADVAHHPQDLGLELLELGADHHRPARRPSSPAGCRFTSQYDLGSGSPALTHVPQNGRQHGQRQPGP